MYKNPFVGSLRTCLITSFWEATSGLIFKGSLVPTSRLVISELLCDSRIVIFFFLSLEPAKLLHEINSLDECKLLNLLIDFQDLINNLLKNMALYTVLF